MKLTVVYNEGSGSAVSKQDIRDMCARHGVEIDQIVAIGPNLKNDLASAIKAGGYIAAIGGDGTVSAVAGLVAGTDAVLVPLPGGTLNNFTKTLDITQDIEEALASAVASEPTRVDIASVNGTYFINNSSMGLYPRSLRHRAQFEDAIGKWPAAALSMLRVLFQYRTYRVTIESKEYVTPFVFVGNNDYRLGEPDGSVRSRLDEGILSVYIVKSTRRFDLLRIFIASALHRVDTLDSFDIEKTKLFTIATNKPRKLSISHDGEVSRFVTPLTYEIHKKSLTVLV